MKSNLASRRPPQAPRLLLEHHDGRKRTRLEIRGWPVAFVSLVTLVGAVWVAAKYWP